MVTAPLWLRLLEKEYETLGTKQAVADKIGISRSTVTTALAGKYPARTEKLEKLVLEKLGTGVHCPYLRDLITQPDCIRFQSQPLTTPNPMARRHRRACNDCEHLKQEGMKHAA